MKTMHRRVGVTNDTAPWKISTCATHSGSLAVGMARINFTGEGCRMRSAQICKDEVVLFHFISFYSI